MRVLLVGPYPPPHGGVSVHVARARDELRAAGIENRVINLDRRALQSPEYMRLRGGMHLARLVVSHAQRGWTVHMHSNGHNLKGWLVSLVCGIAARTAPGSILTLHSGITPRYLARGGTAVRALAALTCRLYTRVICVNSELRTAIAGLGVPTRRLEVLPAFLPPRSTASYVPESALDWMRSKQPLLSTALFFRPEYGFELLVQAVARIRNRLPGIGLVVMGDSENTSAAQRWLDVAGHSGYVLLLGDLAHEICLAVMARSDLFVRATTADGDSISVREALSLGTAVIASNVGERPDGIALFEAGDLADLESRLVQVLSKGRNAVTTQASANGAGRAGRLLEIYAQVTG